MMDAKEQIEQLTADFEKSRKILIALGDENIRSADWDCSW